MQVSNLLFVNRTGKRMPATLALPPQNPKGTMLLVHGLGGFKEQSCLVAVRDRAVDEGYQVLMFDAADGARSPDADFFTATTTSYIRDIEDVVSHLQTESWFKAPLILAGHSQGGLAALRFAAEHPTVVSRLLLIAPFLSFFRSLGAILLFPIWVLVGRWKVNGPDGRLSLSRSFPLDLLRFHVARDIAKITMPTLIVSAERDSVVGRPHEQERMARLFVHAEHKTVPGAGHRFTGQEHVLADIVGQWLSSS